MFTPSIYPRSRSPSRSPTISCSGPSARRPILDIGEAAATTQQRTTLRSRRIKAPWPAAVSFNHLVGAQQNGRGNSKGESFRRPYVYSHLEFHWHLNGQVSRFSATQDLINIGRSATNNVSQVGSVRNQTTIPSDDAFPRIDRRHLIERGQRYDRLYSNQHEVIRHYDEAGSASLSQRSENCCYLGFAASARRDGLDLGRFGGRLEITEVIVAAS